MNNEPPIGGQVIVPPRDNEHVMQAAIVAATLQQQRAIRRRDTRFYPQAMATPPSWLQAGVPSPEPPDWRQDAEREYYYLAHQHGPLMRFLLRYGPNFLRTLRRQHDLHRLRV